MRYTIVKNGIAERVNYLLGTNDTDPGSLPGSVQSSGTTDLTTWSIQASMITNIRRIIKGINGESTNGKIMKGLQIIQDGTSSRISINSGIGFTVAGNIIVLNVNVTKDLITAGTYQIYLMHDESFADPDRIAIDYHIAEIMGTSSTPINIIADDICSNTNDITTIQGQIQITTQDLNVNDGLYLGQVVVTGVTNPYTMVITSPSSSNGMFTASLSGFTSISGIGYYNISQNKCTVFLPALSGTATSNIHILTGFPSGIINSTICSTPVPINIHGSNYMGIFEIGPSSWTLTPIATSFSGAGIVEGLGLSGTSYPITTICYLS